MDAIYLEIITKRRIVIVKYYLPINSSKKMYPIQYSALLIFFTVLLRLARSCLAVKNPTTKPDRTGPGRVRRRVRVACALTTGK